MAAFAGEYSDQLLQRDNFAVNLETRQYHEDVAGNGASPRLQGSWHHENLSLGYNAVVPNGGPRLQSAFEAQVTDDDRVDRRSASIERFYFMGEQDNRYKLTVGDYYVNFSPYVLARSAEGADLALHYQRDSIGDIDVLATYGRLQRGDNGVQFSRWLAGTRLAVRDIRRLRGTLARQWDAGLNFSRAWDDPGSVAYTAGAIRENRGEVASLDAKLLTVGDLEWTGELARAVYWPDRQTTMTSQDGNAYKLAVTRRTGLIPFTAEHEYVSPRFTSMTGSASPDTRRWNLNLSCNPFDHLNLRGNAGLTEDNLTGQKGYTTQSSSLAGGATWVPAPERRADLTLDLDLRERRVSTDTYVTDRVTQTVDFGVRDVVWECPVSVTYGWEKNRDYINSANSSRTATWGAAISRNLRYEKWHFRPGLNYSHSRDWYPATPVSSGMTTTRYSLNIDREDIGTLGLSYQYQNSGRSDATVGLRRDLFATDLALNCWQEHSLAFNLNWTVNRNLDRVGTGTYREDRVELRARYWF